jgi:hypothetical protein
MRIELRYRARVDESIEERHQQIMAGLSQIAPPWGLKGRTPPPAPVSADLGVMVDLSAPLGARVGSYLSYPLRSAAYLRDEAEFDDVMVIEFEPEEIDYTHLARSVFAQYVQAFKAYRGTIILDNDLRRKDWEEIVRLYRETGRDVDGRDEVYRINTVNYFDRELCRRAFNLSPEEIAHRLEGKVERVSLLLDGVLLIVTSELLDRTELEKVDAMVRGYLGVELVATRR